ncbi:MAG: PD40 domain-containing protein [Bacteroidales bacterium]|nr:PD40 domain-containing protein [Bacteroidales bacterium]
MKRLIITIILATAILVGSITPLYAQSPDKLFQKGLIKEEGEGALDKAINIYNKIVENKNADKSLQAKALLHMGLCYEKLGRNEATKAYQRLVNNFPGQENEVAIARERLSRLILIAENIPKGIVIKQVWAGSDVDNYGSVSLDGKYLSFVDWDTGDLAIRNLITGENQRVTHEATLEYPQQFAESNKISPDGKQIAYYWYNEKGTTDLRVINLSNKSQLTLDNTKGEMYPCLWFANGEKIIVQRSGEKVNVPWQLSSINVNTGKSQVLKEFKNSFFTNVSLSPDEKYLAYGFPNVKNKGNSDINLLSIDGKNEIPLIKHPANDRLLGWLPGKKEVLFISDRSGTWDLWAVPVIDGTPSKDAKRIYTDIGEIQPMGFTENGDCLFSFSRRIFNTYIVPFNVNTGELNEQLDKSIFGSNFQAKWSPDGKYLAYIKEDLKADNYWQLTVQDLKTGEERKLATNLVTAHAPCWSPDGNSILVIGRPEKSKFSAKDYKGGIYLVDVKTGQTSEILLLSDYKFKRPTDASSPLSDIEWSLDGKSIFYLFFTDRLVKHDLESGKDEVLYKHSHFNGNTLSRSPDGKSLLFAVYNPKEKKSHLFIIPIKGGKEIELCTSQEANYFGMAAWSPDGKHVFFTEMKDDTNLWRIPAEGGVPEKVWHSKNRAEFLSIHPDEKQIAFSIRERTTEIRVIEGLVPELEKLQTKNEAAELIPKSMNFRKVWAGPDTDNSGTPSPDGRFLTYMDQETGNVAIRELSSGKTHLLTKEGTWEDPMQFTIGSTISPDSRQIAYSWYNLNNNYDVRITDVDDPQAKILYGNKDENVYPCLWSPDGKTIYARSYLNTTGQCRILAITVSNGDIQVLKTFDYFYWMSLSVSPDNQFIAYDVPNDKDGGSFDIHLISTDGKNKTSLIEHPANDRILGWFPDKDQLLFKSDRSGTWDAWIVSVSNGKVSGEPRRLMTNLGQITPMGFTQNGIYYYSIFSRKFTAFTAPLDQIKGELKIGSGKPLLGSISYAEWSPDGNSLAYIKELIGVAGPGWYNGPLFVLDMKTGKEREYKLSDNCYFRYLKWSPDGKTFLVSRYDKKRNLEKNYRGGIYTIEVKSGKISEVITFSKEEKGAGLEWSNDQKSIYYIKNNQLINRELASGQEKILLQDQKFSRSLDLSPDGKNLLFSAEGQIYIIPISGGDPIPVVRVNTTADAGVTMYNNAVWSPNKNYVFFTENMGTDGSILWRISAKGKNPTEIWRSKDLISAISIHPKGQKIVLSTFDQETEIWRLDNLLSIEESDNE